jgi:hypothetical protein
MLCYLLTMNNTTTEPVNEIQNILIAPNHADQPGFGEWLDEVYAQAAEPEPEGGDNYYEDGDDCSEFDGEPEPREDNFRDDVDADADALAGAGYGTDEDYGYFGGEDY